MKRTIEVDAETVIAVRPGDTLIIGVAADITHEQADELRHRLAEQLGPDIAYVVVAGLTYAHVERPAALIEGTPEHKDYVDEAAALADVDVAPLDDPMTPGMPDPCQPIGCDNGHHLPGCSYADAQHTLGA
jgi:hypothetical protein